MSCVLFFYQKVKLVKVGLNKANRIIYGIIGFLFSVACFVYYLGVATSQ